MTEDAIDTKTQKESPAKRFAKEYMKTAQLPLTEEDLAHAFTLGIRYGKGSGWHRVGEQVPTPKHMNEQIVIASEFLYFGLISERCSLIGSKFPKPLKILKNSCLE